MTEPFVIAKGLRAVWQGQEIFRDLSFTIGEGEHWLISGPAGSGKTTLCKTMTNTAANPAALQIRFKTDSSLQPKALFVAQWEQQKNLEGLSNFYYQQRFNSQDAGDAHTVLEEISASTAKLNFAVPENAIRAMLGVLGIAHRADAPVIQLSSGEHKKLQLARALLARTQFLVLDNPYTGLDVQARRNLDELLAERISEGAQLVITGHTEDVPAYITHIAWLEDGQLDVREKAFFTPKNPVHATAKFRPFPSGLVPGDKPFESVVKMVNVSIRYGEKQIFSNINWDVKKGEKWLLSGPNGAGKSTLLSLVNGDHPQAYANELYIFDRRRGTGESIWDIKKNIGFVSPELHRYFERGTSCRNVIGSGFFDTIGLFRKLNATQQNLLEEWIAFLDLKKWAEKPLHMLPTSIQRMALLGRALIKNPALLILDEPCQGLSTEQSEEFTGWIDHLMALPGSSLIYVSHQQAEIPSCITHKLTLKAGEAPQTEILDSEMSFKS
ncbi:MAG: ATP-binding cassette domain-containing protein [Mucilaginibacter polytrichastri]|nr:ATP-binding cassette domain-containing protein [Mucilaginibacter polytrichastri]